MVVALHFRRHHPLTARLPACSISTRNVTETKQRAGREKKQKNSHSCSLMSSSAGLSPLYLLSPLSSLSLTHSLSLIHHTTPLDHDYANSVPGPGLARPHCLTHALTHCSSRSDRLISGEVRREPGSRQEGILRAGGAPRLGSAGCGEVQRNCE